MSELNLDHDEARALHRIVRAMHDGECPKCHAVHQSDKMRFYDVDIIDPFVRPPLTTYRDSGWRCPSCKFQINDAEAKGALQLFAPFMERNLSIFEKWRANLKAKGTPDDRS